MVTILIILKTYRNLTLTIPLPSNGFTKLITKANQFQIHMIKPKKLDLQTNWCTLNNYCIQCPPVLDVNKAYAPAPKITIPSNRAFRMSKP
jgi:hypothetical protein